MQKRARINALTAIAAASGIGFFGAVYKQYSIGNWADTTGGTSHAVWPWIVLFISAPAFFASGIAALVILLTKTPAGHQRSRHL